MQKAETDPTLIGFVGNIAYFGLLTMVVIAAVGQLGVQTTSFIAVLGAAGLAIGLALQGSLANFASGVLIILFRPFRVGDFVEAGGVSGAIDEIGILMTHMHTFDNKALIIPNSQVMGTHIINYTANDTRRCDMVFGISYSDDIDKAKEVFAEVLAEDERCFKDPAPKIAVSELGDSSVNFIVRPWVKSDDYWPVYWDMQEMMKKRLEAAGITIPFPQRDVHLHQ
jgi:small conductance mechanosensitive channel